MPQAQTSRNLTPAVRVLLTGLAFCSPGRGMRHGVRHSTRGRIAAFRYSFDSMQQAVKTPLDHRLVLAEVLDWLVEDKLVTGEAAEQLKKERRYFRGTLHPLVAIAEQK